MQIKHNCENAFRKECDPLWVREFDDEKQSFSVSPTNLLQTST
jgi:hypothetical protein